MRQRSSKVALYGIMTVHHQFFRPVTFESQRLTNDSQMVPPSKRRRHDLSSVFMTVDVPDTPWHPQLSSSVSFEPQRLTEDGATVRASSVPPSSHFKSHFWMKRNIHGVPGSRQCFPVSSGHWPSILRCRRSSMREWRRCTFLHSLRRSMSMPRNNQILSASRLKPLSGYSTHVRGEARAWRSCRWSRPRRFGQTLRRSSSSEASADFTDCVAPPWAGNASRGWTRRL